MTTAGTTSDLCTGARPGRPLRADAARNRALILKAAREVFAIGGLAVTLDEVARHAGLGTGTVYRRFADRDALVEAVFEERLVEHVALLQTCLAQPDPWEGFALLVRTACQELAQDRGLREVMLSKGHGHERVASARDRVQPLVEQLVHRAQEAGVLRPGIAPADVPMLFLMIGTVADFGAGLGPGCHSRYAEVLLEGLRARPGQAELPAPVLDGEELDLAMCRWRTRR